MIPCRAAAEVAEELEICDEDIIEMALVSCAAAVPKATSKPYVVSRPPEKLPPTRDAFPKPTSETSSYVRTTRRDELPSLPTTLPKLSRMSLPREKRSSREDAFPRSTTSRAWSTRRRETLASR